MSRFVRLSESHLWQELREFYESEGVTAWSTDRLPFFATNNPALAQTYLEFLIAFVGDLERAGRLELGKPVCVVELGGGMGRLAYLMLLKLSKQQARLPVPVKYVLTDYSQSNIEFYEQNEKLRPFLDNGMLLLQQLDAEKADQLRVETDNPLFVISNYLFDSLSQDGFRVKDGKLFEATVSKTDDGKVEFRFPPVTEQVYGKASYDKALKQYRETLGNTHFPFPIGPLRCLDSLNDLTGGRMALVMADKALRTREELLGFESLPIQKHDQGFSMSVNCHAVDTVWKDDGGVVFHSAPRANPLNLALYVKGLACRELIRTEHIFGDRVNGFGPLDYLDFRAQILNTLPGITVSLCLQLLRLSYWDPELLYELSNDLGEASLNATLEQKREVYDALVRCWENYYPIPDERDVAFAVGRILACINQFDQAIDFYGESVRLYEARPLTHHNVGICHFNRGRLDEAVQSFQQALELDPDYGPSKELLIRTEAERERRSTLTP